MDPVHGWRNRAAANNAQWCDLVSRSHGALTRFDQDAWTSRTRTPPHYPDAVTLVPSPSLPALLSRVDPSAGCSIKDSFARLDLTEHGFGVLFEAQWIVRTGAPSPSTPAEPSWRRVVDASDLVAWERAWRGDDSPGELFRVDLLHAGDVAVLGAYVDGRVVAGAIGNRSADVVGLTNYFARPTVWRVAWRGCLALMAEVFPHTVIVGYGSGDELIAARAHGFETVGPLRVWIRGGP